MDAPILGGLIIVVVTTLIILVQLFCGSVVVNVIGFFLVSLDRIKSSYIKSRRPKRIILIRHGQSQGNIDPNIYAKIPDNELKLTDKGRDQAKEAGGKLGEIIGKESAFFFVSPFKRSLETYNLIFESLVQTQCSIEDDQCKNKYQFREDPRIRELEWGNFQEPEKHQAVRLMRSWCGRFWYRFENGESGADVYDRASSFLDSLFREMDSLERKQRYENYVLVTHGLFMRLFLMRYFKLTVKEFEKIWNPGNCEMYILEKQDSGKFKLVTDLQRDQPTPAGTPTSSSPKRSLKIPRRVQTHLSETEAEICRVEYASQEASYAK